MSITVILAHVYGKVLAFLIKADVEPVHRPLFLENILNIPSLTLGRTRVGVEVMPPPPPPPVDKVFFELFQDNLSSALAVFSSCVHTPWTHFDRSLV